MTEEGPIALNLLFWEWLAVLEKKLAKDLVGLWSRHPDDGDGAHPGGGGDGADGVIG